MTMYFCMDMYRCGFRNSYKSRIKFVVMSLRSWYPACRRKTRWDDLPWGTEAMPMEEALEIANEYQNRTQENVDYTFAFQMQMVETSVTHAITQARYFGIM